MKLFKKLERFSSEEVYITELYNAQATQDTADGKITTYKSIGTHKYVAVVKNEEGCYVNLENSDIIYGSEGDLRSVPVIENGVEFGSFLYPVITEETKYSFVHKARTGKEAGAKVSRRKAIEMAKQLTAEKLKEEQEKKELEKDYSL